MWCTSSNSRIVTFWPAHSSIKLLLVVVQSLPLSSASTFVYFLMFWAFGFWRRPICPLQFFSSLTGRGAFSNLPFPPLNRSTLLLLILFPLLSSSYLPSFTFWPPLWCCQLSLSCIPYTQFRLPSFLATTLAHSILLQPCQFSWILSYLHRPCCRLSIPHPLLPCHHLPIYCQLRDRLRDR